MNPEEAQPSNEPEIVRALSEGMRAAGQNGKQGDNDTLIRIYADWKWGLKKDAMTGNLTYPGIEATIEAAIKRIRKQVKDQALAAKAIAKFDGAKAKLAEAVAAEGDKQVESCPACELPRFLCVCRNLPRTGL